MICECCKVEYKANNPLEAEWRQYCGSCFGRKGNDEYDIVVAGTNSRGYAFYKVVPKRPSGFMFIEED